MAALVTLLERAVSDSSVHLDASSQKAIFAFSHQSPELRAALAGRHDLADELRGPLSGDDSIDCRAAFLSRSDLSEEEISALVASERRTTLLKSVAQSTSDPDILTLLAKKGGKGLQRLVAFNPATPDEARLSAARVAFRGKDDIPYKDRHEMYVLLADSPAVLAWALTDDEALALRGVAITFVPYATGGGFDRVRVLENSITLLEENADRWVRAYSMPALSSVGTALVEVAWMLDDAARGRLLAVFDQVIAGMREWNSHSLRAARDRLAAGKEKLAQAEAEALASRELLRACSESSSSDELEQAAAQVRAAGGYQASALMSLASLALVRNPSTPLASLYSMATRAGGGIVTVARQAAVGSPRLAALMVATGRQLPDRVSRSVTPSEVCAAASREDFWPRTLVSWLLSHEESARQVLLEAPTDALPSDLDAGPLQKLVDILGERTSDRQWLETAVSLSSGWSGRLSDLVELADNI